MKRRLYRSRENKLLGGVLAGSAEYFDHDPTLWRLGFVIVLFVTGLMPFLFVYLIAWILIPEDPLIKPVHKSEYTVSNE